MNKHIVLVGGSGLIGSILAEELQSRYRITVIDLKEPERPCRYIRADAANYGDIRGKLPQDADAVVNLLKIDTGDEIGHLDRMIDVYLKASVHILYAAAELGIPKVIFASSNHVTDAYEQEGESLLGRPIHVRDYPYSMSMYGILKLASENVGYMVSAKKGLSVLNIRIGSVPRDERQALKDNRRMRRTLLTRSDVAALFQAAIEANVRCGTYYGVSDNPGKPWDTANARSELGFVSVRNAEDIASSLDDE
ncbi:NAD-dependent epimerase/dehydratase family protein [Paenibacillus thailandensis]|uniref:NAD-dependent epimerase/dehydratase family protein n=1 Tax=Paenibacillus thailandensis TaxID=393250 RepID=A0ABW5R365_9BACL